VPHHFEASAGAVAVIHHYKFPALERWAFDQAVDLDFQPTDPLMD
jgi:hypothetical protein